DGERVPHILDVVVLDLVEAVDGHQVRQAAVLEEVDGRETVRQAPRVDQHHRADRATYQLIPHEPEPGLTWRAEQVEDQVTVDRDPPEVHRDRRGRLARHVIDVVHAHPGRGHDGLGGQWGDLRHGTHQCRLAHAEPTGDDYLRRGDPPWHGAGQPLIAVEVHSTPSPAVPYPPLRSRPETPVRTPPPGHPRPCPR